jgi:hypothetical protein
MARLSKNPSWSTLKKDLADRSGPKTTRVEAAQRREPEHPPATTSQAIGRKLDAMPDRVDIRDWIYQPTLAPLPNQIVNINRVPKILDQKAEGACTGFALAGVINFELASRNMKRLVSPRMLYEMARKYDEWPGEEYEGSSARGAMIGWVRHGVCAESLWQADLKGAGHFDSKRAHDARLSPGGAFYRVMHRQVRDMHAALFELGAVYMTIMVHRGWLAAGTREGTTRTLKVPVSYEHNGKKQKIELPVIQRQGNANDGHAVAILGYTESGFIIQNSWGEKWGCGGFALLPYEDFMLHATDVWVAQLGVPVRVDVWSEMDAADTTAGAQRGSQAIPLTDIRPHVVDCGYDGQLSDSGEYWTSETDVERLFRETIPTATKKWRKKRVLLYLHGGLNGEVDVAKRVVAFRDVMLANEIYPLHIMWESGPAETLNDLIRNAITKQDERAGGIADWMHKLRDHLVEAKDRTFELTTARLGMAMWDDMKRNARLSSTSPDKRGAMQIIAKQVIAVLSGVTKAERSGWEFHVVAHSAGSIYFAHALQHLLEMSAQNIRFESVHFMAPAITTELFNTLVLPYIQSGDCPLPSLFVLSNVGELDDSVGPYGKSLLYLVSNAFEGKRETPILGMEKFLTADQRLQTLWQGKTATGHPSLVIAGQAPVNGTADPYSTSRSDSHGGFDDDPDTLNSILLRILNPADGKLPRLFVTRDLQY